MIESTVDSQAEAVRARVHGMWANVAPAWGEYAEYADVRGAGLTTRMLELAGPQPGERVLELACGAGGLGIAAAQRVGTTGEIVLSDVVAGMTEVAGARARAVGARNVSTRVLDIEQIDEPSESYDVVLCREGLMFAFEPARAAGELRRVLRTGGRFAVAVWGPRARNPWLGIVFDAVSAQLGMPIPPPGIPGPFALEDRDRLGEILEQAGLAEVTIEEFSLPTRAASLDEWWTRTCALAGPLASVLAGLPEDAADALRARAQDAAAPYQTDEGLELPGVTLIASGTRR